MCRAEGKGGGGGDGGGGGRVGSGTPQRTRSAASIDYGLHPGGHMPTRHGTTTGDQEWSMEGKIAQASQISFYMVQFHSSLCDRR